MCDIGPVKTQLQYTLLEIFGSVEYFTGLLQFILNLKVSNILVYQELEIAIQKWTNLFIGL